VTTLAPHVVSAISGGGFEPWHYARSADEQHEVIGRLLGEPDGHVLFYVWDRPAGGERGKYPAQQLKIVFRDGYGAVHFTNSDPEHGPVGAWLARSDSPPAVTVSVEYDPWDPERVILPAEALLPVWRLREVAAEYAATGHQPQTVQWTAVDFV
jgi:hypothetical protein